MIGVNNEDLTPLILTYYEPDKFYRIDFMEVIRQILKQY